MEHIPKLTIKITVSPINNCFLSGRFFTCSLLLYLLFTTMGISSDLLLHVDWTEPTQNLQDLLDQASRQMETRRKAKISFVLRHNSHKGYAFILFAPSCLDVARVLVGLNPDGSKRVKVETDANWTPPTQEDIDALETKIATTTDWANLADLEDELESMQQRPTVHIQLPPLYQVPGLEFQMGWAYNPPSGSQTNVLHTQKPITWLKESRKEHVAEFAKKVYSKFSSDTTKVPRKVYDPKSKKRVQIMEAYPHIEVGRDNKVYITFKPSSDDAAIALLMANSLNLINSNTNALEECKLWYPKSK